MQSFHQFCQENGPALRQLLEELTLTAAPSHDEDPRAEKCRQWLEQLGAKGITIDPAKNLRYPLRMPRDGKWIIFSAHLDTVFDHSVPLALRQEEDRLYCPGIGDDTANLTVMLFGIKYLLENGLADGEDGILFAGTACEECGSLGTRYLIDDIGPENIRLFYSFDATYHSVYTDVVNRAIYTVTAHGPGGHALGAYGRPNAIEELAKLIVTVSGQCRRLISGLTEGRSAFNVDTIQGGKGNCIAEEAVTVMQFRSTEKACCHQMENFLADYIAGYDQPDVRLTAELMAEAPLWSTVDRHLLRDLGQKHLAILQRMGISSHLSAATTDCRYPLYKGIPSLCMGLCDARNPHMLNEYMFPTSLEPGLEYLLEIFRLNEMV